MMVGKKAATATPTWALAEAMRRSAEAMSGRRSSSSEGTPTGTDGGAMANFGTRRDAELGRRLADQHRNGVLELRAADPDVDRLGPGRFELGLGGGDIGLGGGAGIVAVLGDLQRAGEGHHRGIEQALQIVGDAELEIIGRQRRLGREPHSGELGAGGLRAGRGAFDVAADLAP